jgi:hypothetical protein
LLTTNSNKSSHPENLGKVPPELETLQPFENADKISKHMEKYKQPDGKTPAGASDTT